ncbi:MAG: site-specific DNA-methyltransferase [Nitrosomonadales bacterium]|nr:site-specific DNA-methyltransferase [Nitrosomonadales bacterium]
MDMAQALPVGAQLFEQTGALKLHFTVAEAEEGAHNNVKAAGERYFIVDAAQPLEWNNGELTVRFNYCADPGKTGQAGKWREMRNARNEAAILNALQTQGQSSDENAHRASQYAAALTTEITKGKDGTQKLLAKYLNQYTARNSMDYFIHKNLGGFLKRELDFYIKNELFRLDDLGTHEAPNPQQYDKLLKKALTLRSVAHKLIEFLAQTEEFQKKLWLKKKFVVDTQWLITLDKVPASLYPQIKANYAQWAEWVKLGFVNVDADRDALLNGESKLVLDTQFFAADFTAQLLAHISQASGNLDDATNGVLVHSENFQALNLMQERYREQVKCIYIDPPYNTSEAGFIYKNQYKHSSWLSMIADRVNLSMRAMYEESVLCCAIDDYELPYLEKTLDGVLGFENRLGNLVIEIKPSGRTNDKYLATSHEYILFYARNHDQASIDFFPLTEEQAAKYCEGNEEERYKWRDFLRTGGFSTPEERKNSYYEIYFNPDTGKADIEPFDGAVTIKPVDSLGKKRVWRKTKPSFLSHLKKGEITFVQNGNDKWKVKIIDRIKDGTRPKSVWVGPKYDASSHGTKLIKSQFGGNADFSFPKSVHAVYDTLYINTISDDSSLILDYFAGSGTTGHAVINLNREDNGRRKYLLVEMGDYFDTVLKPRIAKVIYSADWKDGKPTAPKTGISQLVKVIRLESYEDTLNNLRMAEESAHSKVIAANSTLREGYFLHYLLELETQGSPSLLNMADFNDPTAYTLKIKKPGSEAQEARTVDLVETFNWLLGLRVSKLHAPQIFTASFTEKRDAELPQDARARWVVEKIVPSNQPSPQPSPPAPLPQAGEGSYWFRAVEGEAPDAGGRLKRVLVVWRKLTGNLEHDNLVLEAYLREALGLDVRHPGEHWPAVLYVNGSHALPAMPHCEARQLEDIFHRLMWDVQDA